MATTLATYFLFCYLNTTSVADDAFVTDALILTTSTFVVFSRTENPLTEKAITLGLIGAVIDGFRFSYLSIGILKDFFRRS